MAAKRSYNNYRRRFSFGQIIYGFIAFVIIVGGAASFTLSQMNTDNRSDAYSPTCNQYVLNQSIWRGNQGWTRTVPIVNHQPNWGAASDFQLAVDLRKNPNAMPGSGDVQEHRTYVKTDNELFQDFARGGKKYDRSIPIIDKSTPQWNRATEWSVYDGPHGHIFNTTSLQAMTTTYTYDQIMHTAWLNNKGYTITHRRHPQTRGWVSEPDYKLVLDLNKNPNALPGRGNIQTVSNYTSSDNKVLNQTIWRGNEGWIRSMPIRNNVPQYSEASEFTKVMDLNENPNALPGDGELQSLNVYISCK